MKQSLSAWSGADTAMRCDASAGAMLRGSGAEVRRSRRGRIQLALNAAQSSEGEERRLISVFRLLESP